MKPYPHINLKIHKQKIQKNTNQKNKPTSKKTFETKKKFPNHPHTPIFLSTNKQWLLLLSHRTGQWKTTTIELNGLNGTFTKYRSIRRESFTFAQPRLISLTRKTDKEDLFAAQQQTFFALSNQSIFTPPPKSTNALPNQTTKTNNTHTTNAETPQKCNSDGPNSAEIGLLYVKWAIREEAALNIKKTHDLHRPDTVGKGCPQETEIQRYPLP